jgi:DNA-binding transcriptional regulator YiaG
MSSSPLTPAAIKAGRRRLGLTQEQFAARVGCSPLAVSFWERGTRAPTGLYAREVRRLLAEADATDPGLTPPPPGPGPER